MKTKPANTILLILGLIPLIFWIYRYVNVDLWYDEVQSIKQFVLVNFSTTVLKYPEPNNHIFFNITSQLISRLTNFRDINKIAEHVYVFRLFQALITFFTAYYSVLIVKRFFKADYSLIIIPILFTTIPFMNFSLQLRGYNMSSLFLVMIVYHTWSFIENRDRRNRMVIVISSALFLYTIPSNIYMLASLIMILAFLWLYNKKQRSDKSHLFLKSVISICIGAGVAAAFYSPVLKDIFSNRFVTREPGSIFFSLQLIPRLFLAFLTKRYLLIILFIFGSWFFIRQTERKEKQLFLALIFLFVFPFILSFFHQRFPFQRVFISISPIFCVLISVPIIKLVQKIRNSYVLASFTFLLSLYCMAVFFNEIKTNNIEIKDRLIRTGRRTQDIYQNYYLSDSFKPKETIHRLKLISGNEVVYIYDQIDSPSTDLYLSINEQRYIKTDSINRIESTVLKTGNAFILTSHKTKTIKQLDKLATVTSTVIMDEYPFSNIISVTEKKLEKK